VNRATLVTNHIGRYACVGVWPPRVRYAKEAMPRSPQMWRVPRGRCDGDRVVVANAKCEPDVGQSTCGADSELTGAEFTDDVEF
jgi:hypothetical protein